MYRKQHSKAQRRDLATDTKTVAATHLVISSDERHPGTGGVAIGFITPLIVQSSFTLAAGMVPTSFNSAVPTIENRTGTESRWTTTPSLGLPVNNNLFQIDTISRPNSPKDGTTKVSSMPNST